MSEFITQHGIRCLDCGSEIYSNSGHDFVTCACDPDDIETGCYIDGGFGYVRVGGDPERMLQITRVVDRTMLPSRFRDS